MDKSVHIQFPDSYSKTGIFNVAQPIVISQMGYQFLRPSIVLPVPRFLVSALKFLGLTVHE